MSEKTQIVLKKETSLSTTSSPRTSTAFEGFLLKVSVERAHLITDKIFVMQRDVDSAYIADGVLDSFFSVASVGEIEWIPEDAPAKNSENFFRTNEIELVFESREDLDSAWKKIKFDVAALARANDVTYEIAYEEFYPFPEDSLPMYYGVSHLTLSEDQIVDSLSENPKYGRIFEFPFAIEQDSYVYVAIHKNIGQNLAVSINGSALTTVVEEVELESKYGGPSNQYLLYRTENKIFAPLSGRVYTK